MRWLRRISCLVLSLMVALVFTGCSSQKVIINGLDEREANEILVFLSTRNIDAQKIKAESEGPGGGGKGLVLWDVAVPYERSTEAMAVLSANGLPRRRAQNLLDLFAAGGLVPSEMQEKIRYQAGLAEQIASTIRKIDGILDADVQLSFPEEDPLNPKEKKQPVTASVFVKHQGVLDDPNSHLITKIRRLVSSSVQGLKFENVTVISDKGRFAERGQALLRSASSNIELVRVWGVSVAKASVGRFQKLFFGIISLLALATLSSMWFFWKVLPVARECGGIKTLFFFHPFELNVEEEVEVDEDEDEENEKEEGDLPSKEGEKASKEEPREQENIESL